MTVDAAASSSHFVFVRWWPGFTASFAFDDFAAMGDIEAESEIRHALAVQLNHRRRLIVERRRQKYQKWLNAVKVANRNRLGVRTATRPTKATPVRQAYRQSVRVTGNSRYDRFARLASEVDWHKGHGLAVDGRTGQTFLFSPKFWLCEANSIELAKVIISQLADLRPDNADEYTQREFLNPQFGLVPCRSYHFGEQAAVRVAIEVLRTGQDNSTFAGLAVPYLQRAQLILAASQSSPGKPSTSDNSPPIVEPERTEGDGKRLTPAVQNAWASWLLAVENHATEPTDREAYDWLIEQDFDAPLAGYRLPTFATWAKYVRAARQHYGANKYSSREGRAGRSIVHRADLD